MNKKHKKILIPLILALTILAGIKIYQSYQNIFGSNVQLEKEKKFLYIPSGSNFDTVVSYLNREDILKDSSSFIWVARKKNYHNHVYPGKYLVRDNMSNNTLINLLRAAKQEPVDLVFNNLRTEEDLAGIVAKQIEADSSAIIKLLNDNDFLEQFGFNSKTVLAMFIPNTYEFWWNTSAEKFIKRMQREHDKFWSEKRRKNAEKIDFTPIEVSILASIVDEETIKKDEMNMIAGVYINRLEKGMRLQADPTIKYALGDFSIKRILDKHLVIESPYNTYKNSGLPPGPISIPSIASIDAVLNYKNHDYFYFSAKADFSGYHNFSETHYQHIINAQKYRKALNERKIWK